MRHLADNCCGAPIIRFVQSTCSVSSGWLLATAIAADGGATGWDFGYDAPWDGRGVKMKIYEGRRTMDGLVVTVDGAPLSEHDEVKQFTKRGFEWAYEGTSPRQLALAILFDYTGDRQRVVELSEPFMKNVVANFDNDWRLTGEQIDSFLCSRRA
jgi:Family of unknown function (DUF6166)